MWHFVATVSADVYEYTCLCIVSIAAAFAVADPAGGGSGGCLCTTYIVEGTPSKFHLAFFNVTINISTSKEQVLFEFTHHRSHTS